MAECGATPEPLLLAAGKDARALVREPDGDIDFGLGRDATAAGGESVLAKLFSGESAQGAAPAAQFLRSIVVQDGQLSLLDRQTGFRTQAGAVKIEIRPSPICEPLNRAGSPSAKSENCSAAVFL